ncbi:hypothetical protein CWE13_02045 [Aliidiomarina shirensis]|uniref:Uncharacterized protein n=1 Tax=Aliidiomarina shirensis TaxID=1048642 RepID=A0A432WXD5_9GAMM|nr:hypothetical protein [Aliidiomarina shirensis]RUO38444.1 hypothetical protein CWE13_02045 [Aliidiomarina shirensis]
MEANYRSEHKHVKFRLIIMGFFVFILLNIININTATAQDTDTVYACDTCDYDKAYWIAGQNVPAPTCTLNQELEETPGSRYTYCSSEFRTFIVANPVTEQAFKFNVHIPCVNGTCNYLVPSISKIPIPSNEQNDLEAFYALDQELRAAVNSLNSGSQSIQDIPAIAFNQNEQTLLTNYGVSIAQCENSPVQYFLSDQWKNDLKEQMASDLGAANQFRTFTALKKSDELGDFSVGRQQIEVNFAYNRGEQYVRKNFGDPFRNALHFRVEYRGNVYSESADETQLTFILVPDVSWIDGVNLADFMSGGHEDLVSRGTDLGCLPLILENLLYADPVSEGNPEWVTNDNAVPPFADKVERCYKVVKGSGSAPFCENPDICHTITVGFLGMCSSNIP